MKIRMSWGRSLLLSGLAGSLVMLSACEDKTATGAPAANAGASAQAQAAGDPVATATRTVQGIRIEDVTEGTGTAAKKGDTVSVNYLGTLASNGKKFDSSYDRNEPFVFRLGSGQVIEGWEKGIVGMKVGGKRILTIPPEQAYGEGGAPPVIPPNSTLKFEVELMGVN